MKKGALKSFVKFTGKHLAQVFSCEFGEIFKNIFFIEHFRPIASAFHSI